MGLRERESEDTDVIHVIHEASRTMSRRMEKTGRIKCDTESSFPSASENKHSRVINIEVGKRKITILEPEALSAGIWSVSMQFSCADGCTG